MSNTLPVPENNNPLAVADFTSSVSNLLTYLETKFPNDSLCISDIVDAPSMSVDELKKLGVEDTRIRQYVDLVQEGGGVHGIALAGYTYVLEKMGVSFTGMAGTSAGAINTMLLSCVYSKREAALLGKDVKNYYETRSEKLLEYLAKKPLSELVDGHPWWKKIIINAFTGIVKFSNITKYLKKFALYLLLFVFTLTLLLISTIGNTVLHCEECLPTEIAKWTAVVSGLLLFVSICFIAVQIFRGRMLYLFSERLGINPGDDFEKWVKGRMDDNGIGNVEDLKDKLLKEENALNCQYKRCEPEKKATEKLMVATAQVMLPAYTGLPELKNKIEDPDTSIAYIQDQIKKLSLANQTKALNIVAAPDSFTATATEGLMESLLESFQKRVEQYYDNAEVKKQIVIVAADISNQIKVEFPGMHKMYWGNDFSISPAKYVRASMSIPAFFSPFKVEFNDAQINNIRNAWLQRNVVKQFGKDKNTTLFVDGGLLSNFPINVFFNPEMPVPSRPTLGIKLEYDDDPANTNITSELGLVGSMVSTMRYFYDRDFINNHNMYKKTVRSIDTGNINWLNFNLTAQEQIELFFRGALTATIFLSKHKMTDTEQQQLLNFGTEVASPTGTFSIYGKEPVSFKTEDFLVDNITFEWNDYKMQRMMPVTETKSNQEDLKENAGSKK